MVELEAETEPIPQPPLKVNFNPNSPVTLGYAHFDSFESIEKYDPFIQQSPNRKTNQIVTQRETGISWFYRKLADINNYIFQNGTRNGFYFGMVAGILLTDQTETINVIA